MDWTREQRVAHLLKTAEFDTPEGFSYVLGTINHWLSEAHKRGFNEGWLSIGDGGWDGAQDPLDKAYANGHADGYEKGIRELLDHELQEMFDKGYDRGYVDRFEEGRAPRKGSG